MPQDRRPPRSQILLTSHFSHQTSTQSSSPLMIVTHNVQSQTYLTKIIQSTEDKDLK